MATVFLSTLYDLLESNLDTNLYHWAEGGKLVVYDSEAFEQHIMIKVFPQLNKFHQFEKLLLCHDFIILSQTPKIYRHPYFIIGKRHLVNKVNPIEMCI